MGDWTLIVSGTGCHHNNGTHGAKGIEEDADQRLLEIVDRLCKDGHFIKHAAIVHGGGADTVEIGYPAEGGNLQVRQYKRATGETQDAQALLASRKVRRQAKEGSA